MKRLAIAIMLVLALGASGLAAGCGEEEELHVVEGEPLELGELAYNVQITRFLNPDDPEDEGYLAGQKRPEPGQAYLGVFLTVENDGDEDAEVPYAFRVVDTDGNEYEPVPSRSVYALQIPGFEDEIETELSEDEVSALQPSTVPAHGEIPIPSSTAAVGVIGGAMLLFQVEETVAENRPLELEVPGAAGERGIVELDI